MGKDLGGEETIVKIITNTFFKQFVKSMLSPKRSRYGPNMFGLGEKGDAEAMEV